MNSCTKNHEMYGYIESKYTYMSSVYNGNLLKISVKKGDFVKKGDTLFALDATPENLAITSGSAQMESANRNLEAKKIAQTQSENSLAIARSQQEQAKSNFEFWKKQFDRAKNLLAKKAITTVEFDNTKNNFVQSEKSYDVAKSNVEQSKLATSQAKENVKSAQSEVENLKANVDKSTWDKLQKRITAPDDGFVFDTYYNDGEMVLAGRPVVSLLSPKNTYALFFVGEKDLAKIKIGQKISIECDNCKEKIPARVSFLSPQAEYTSPLIYSDAEREHLVFRAEALFDEKDTQELKPGLAIRVWTHE